MALLVRSQALRPTWQFLQSSRRSAHGGCRGKLGLVRGLCSAGGKHGSSCFVEYNHFKTLDVTKPAHHVMQVAIDRPNKANAMTSTFFRELRQCIDALAVDPDCRAIVICGAGAMFSSGLDLEEHAAMFMKMAGSGDDEGKGGTGGSGGGTDPARTSFANMRFVTRMQESLGSLQACPKPVISAVHGACIGGGVDLVCATDIRLATSDAWFSIKEVDIGLCADLGTLQRLPQLIGNDSLVRELVFTARRFSASEALDAGFLSTILHNKQELLDHAHQLASQIASRSPVGIQGSKVNLNYGRDHGTSQALHYQALWSAAMLQTKDIPHALAAVVNHKAPPNFPPL